MQMAGLRGASGASDSVAGAGSPSITQHAKQLLSPSIPNQHAHMRLRAKPRRRIAVPRELKVLRPSALHKVQSDANPKHRLKRPDTKQPRHMQQPRRRRHHDTPNPRSKPSPPRKHNAAQHAPPTRPGLSPG